MAQPSQPALIDAHAHLYFDSYDTDRGAVIQAAKREGIEHVVTVGTDLRSSRAALEMAARDPWQTATVGIHPHASAQALSPEYWNAFLELASEAGFAAIGECGLDYFKNYAPRDAQRETFRKQIHLANERSLPLVIHTRNAHTETVELLKTERDPRHATVIHCFTGSAEQASDYLELGISLSFSGALTYKNNRENREAAAMIPADKLMIETDAPFLPPSRIRGKRNAPEYLRHTFNQLVNTRHADATGLAQVLRENTIRFFGIGSSQERKA